MIKVKFKKIKSIMLSLLMIISTLQIVSIKEVRAVDLYPEATSKVSSSWLTVDMSGTELGGTAHYADLSLGGSTAFCLDKGKRLTTGTKYARLSTKTNSMYNRVWNYWSSQGGGLTGENSAFAQGMMWALSEGVSTSNYSAYGKILSRTLEGVYGINPYPSSQMENWAEQALTYGDTSGSLYVYGAGMSSYQRLITGNVPDITYPIIINKRVSSTKSYKTSESIKSQVNKNDIDTNQKLSGVSFDFYKDGVKGGSATTNALGIAEYTFTTEFSKEATASKDYCSNYDDLSIPNQELVTGYTSKAEAQAAADAEALAKAKELAEAGSGQEHTYKVVETATKTNYWLNPATNTYEKKHTGSGTVEFNIGNKRQVGSITITKKDSETDNLVDNAVYGLYARSNIVHPDGVTGILYTKDQLVGTFAKTGANGQSTLNNLYLGQYYVSEITAPSGYLHSSEKYNVDLSYAGQNVQVTDASSTVKDKVQRAKVTSIKQDKELDNGSKNPDIFDFNKDGAQADATRVGAIYGLYAHENINHADGTTGVVQYNQVNGSIHELKAAKGTDLQVKNVKANAGTLLATIKTDANGEFGFENLYNGKYYIQEMEPSQGYTLDSTKYYIDLSYTNQNEQVVIKSNQVLETVAKQAFDIAKVGHVPGTSTNATPLGGVEFTVWLESDIQSFINKGKTLDEAKQLAPVYDKLVTASDGTASSIELPYGKYRVAETKGAADHNIADDFFVTVSEDSRTHQSFTNNIIINEKFIGLIEAVKLDRETGKQVKLEGTEFKIKNLDKDEYIGYWEWFPFPHYVTTWTTNSEGYVRLQEEFEAGNYQLEEIHAPVGYVLDTEPVQFRLSKDNMYQTAEDGVTAVIRAYKSDVSAKGKIEINKNGEVLTDYDQDTNKFIYEVKGLKDAEYNIYAENPILDPSNDGTVLFNKDELVTTIKTGTDGKGISEELPLGDYYSREKTAPNGFVISDEIKHFTLKYEDETVSIVYDEATYVNDRQKVTVETSKQNTDTEEFVEGAEISLYANRDVYNYDGNIIVKAGTLLETAITGKDGKATFESDLPNDLTPEYAVMPINDNDDLDSEFNNNVIEGTKLVGDPNSLFVVKETKAPDGYIPFAVNYYIDTKYTAQNESVLKFEAKFFNEQTITNFDKKDASTDKSINNGGEYQIIDPVTNKVVTSWVGNGKIHIEKGLVYEKEYIWHEVKAPEGYDLAEDVRFTVSKNGTVIMKDNPLLTIEKLDKVDNFIVPGNELELRDAETNKVVQSIVTTDHAIILDNLTTGKEYILKETKQVEGYYLNSEELRFTFVPGMTVQFYNNPIMTDIRANKLDSQTMKPVLSADFEFTMYSDAECKNAVRKVNANTEDGTATFKNVRYGIWYIKETKAPKGYQLSSEVKKVVVNDDLDGVGDLYSFVYLNTLLPTTIINVPTEDQTQIVLLSVLMIGGLISIWLFKKKKTSPLIKINK